MSRGFSEDEKREIKKKLIVSFEEQLAKSNISKISIDDLVYRAGISKGSFYAFYPSKELLFVDVVHHVQEKLLMKASEVLADDRQSKKKRLKDMFFIIYHHIETYPWLLKLTSIEYEKSIRKLPSELRNELISQDNKDIEMVLEQLDIETDLSLDEISAALRTILFSIEFNNKPKSKEGVSLLINGLIDQIIND
ncbi:TetR family transcriptional regulator [Amphibacillus cookii]|uniref:TetR family transcriptional regulator n=1 Tax=Amphibacillus cookii TaxID=767787 RepID=UPI00195BA1C4|nr:AcrR family transcriptional regulator [Amphibacillus cookii]